ncbi:MAG: hypothetical protein ACJA0V_003736 [Planctomycetota bacterium]|jgi:hypothetical protein
MNRRRWLVVLLSVVVLPSFGGYLFWPQWDGARAARSDLSRGQPRYMLYGELAPYEEEATRLLAEQHGLAAQRIALCVVSGREMERADSYNSVVCEHLDLSPCVFDDLVASLIQKHR